MLVLHPEILKYIIKTHCISAESSMITEIRMACDDFERSQEYGKQLAALQSHNNVPQSLHPKSSQSSTSQQHKLHRKHTANTFNVSSNIQNGAKTTGNVASVA
jgi:hypothetical protein